MDQSNELFEIAINLEPEDSSIYYWKAKSYREFNIDLGQSMNLINTAIEMDRSAPAYFIERGLLYLTFGDIDKAEKDLLSSLESNPDQAYVINYLAYSWIEKGMKISQSLEMLERANNLRSNDPYIIDSLGWALFKLERYDESKNYLQSAVKLMPADPIINDHYGDVLWKNGNKIQARYFWKYVLNLKETEKDMKENIKDKLISGL